MTQQHVLVTGGSGFIAGHCILQLLADGHTVRATLRSLAGEPAARAALEQAGMRHGERLHFVAADLLQEAGWADAMGGIDGVLHVASPVQPGHVADEDDLIVPAREGTLRVLRAAHGARVRRVVLTSAFHAVSWGHRRRDHVFTEADWTILEGPGVDAYGKSKTIAERAAWDFVAAQSGAPELVTMLPVAVMGPVIGRSVTGANHIVQRMLKGDMPGLPNLFIPIVDVRDVARAHVLALGSDAAAGERFLISNGPPLAMKDIGAIIRAAMGSAAARVPTRSIPDLMMRLLAIVRPELRHYLPDLGYRKQTTNVKARNFLGWAPRPAREAIAAAAESMVGTGLV